MENKTVHPNEALVNRFFEAYSKHDTKGIKEVMSDNIRWSFPGVNPFAGKIKGIDALVAFFDRMAVIMNESKPQIEKLIVASNDKYCIECQHIKVNRPDGINIDHHVTVLWTIENGKIVEGRHFWADPQAVDKYFNAIGALKKSAVE